MNFAVLRFPGSNCDDDALHVVDRVLAPLGASGRIVWHKDTSLAGVDAVIVPGGFSYGDYLRAGAIAAHSPIMGAVRRFAEAGGPVLGICNGFQILCEAGLLDGALTRNESLQFVCADVYCVVEGRPTPFTHAIPAGRHLRMSIAHADGRYVHPDVDALEAEGRVVFRYCSKDGEVVPEANPNGSMHNIAGVCNAAGNVVGLMPHPERACEHLLGEGGEDGRCLFECALAWQRGRPARV
ncbi:MAG: phosphoribosylformylglycinamidine synthase subunit PurQ [Deltaproteobacteria bacterium]|nr:MAG: phosphoribosylformylglycinamidine synthase subunit PurQ [Deltaproteobacteria bacterium]